MSRYYGMSLIIERVAPDRIRYVKRSARHEWPFEDWHLFEGDLSSYGESNLCGGEGEEEFADRLAHAIWRANKKFCEVIVNATYLEELPHETHIRSKAEYRAWLQRSAVKTKE